MRRRVCVRRLPRRQSRKVRYRRYLDLLPCQAHPADSRASPYRDRIASNLVVWIAGSKIKKNSTGTFIRRKLRMLQGWFGGAANNHEAASDLILERALIKGTMFTS